MRSAIQVLRSGFYSRPKSPSAILALHPLLGAPRKFIRTRYADSRLWRVNEFPQFLIIYRPIQDGVLVQRVVRAAVDYTRL
jgi:hypothetical protein